MKIEDSDKYVLDVMSTLLSNIFYPFQIGLLFYFIWQSSELIKTLETATAQLLALIVFLFADVKLIGWIQLPHLQFKPREAQKKNV